MKAKQLKYQENMFSKKYNLYNLNSDPVVKDIFLNVLLGILESCTDAVPSTTSCAKMPTEMLGSDSHIILNLFQLLCDNVII